MTDQLFPALGDVLYDAEGRELTVHGVFPGDHLGREVRGQLLDADGGESCDYACDQRTWAAIWRDRKPLAVFQQ